MNATRRRITRSSSRKTAVIPISQAASPNVVRLSRVRTALQRISSGYYDRDEVRDRLAMAVLKELQNT
jgi:hypothetical protein